MVTECKGYRVYAIGFSLLEVCFKFLFNKNCSFALIFSDHNIIALLWKITNLHSEHIWKNYLLQLALMINSDMEYFHTLIICFLKH